MMKMNEKSILFFGWVFTLLILSCDENKKDENEKKDSTPAFCDCVNKDYHLEGDREKCKEIERELTHQLKMADQTEKGEILMKIQDCKVKGQYDND